MRNFFFVLLLITAHACHAQPRFGVVTSQPAYYTNGTGDRFTVTYGHLSDSSLYFIKIKLPDSREYTLPRSVSASGVRYTDEKDLVWWEHQGIVRVEMRGNNGEWVTKYSGLRPE